MELTRQYAQQNTNTVIIAYGDNLLQKGMGGQAREFRYLPNCYGIPTKKKPSMQDNAFFTDIEYVENIKAINLAVNKIPYGRKIIVCPLGVGYAMLPQKAPLTFDYVLDQARMLTRRNNMNDYSIPERECQELAEIIKGAHVTSKAGVPHVIKRINHTVVSCCYFQTIKEWRLFYPYGELNSEGQYSFTYKYRQAIVEKLEELKDILK